MRSDTSMKAVIKDGSSVQLVEKPSCKAGSQPSSVMVNVSSVGICGSDLSLLKSGFPLSHTLGHEIAGVTEDGRAVAIEPIVFCGRCDHCLLGRHQHCVLGAANTVLGIGHDGGMAEKILVPEFCLHELPSGLNVYDACLAEPLAVAVHGLRLAEEHAGQKIAIVGAGTIGLCAAAVATKHSQVFLQARHAHQLAAGEALGAKKLESQGEFDLVVDAVGSPEAIEQCLNLCRPGATLLLLASYDNIVLPGYLSMQKEIRFQTAMTYGRDNGFNDFAAAVQLLSERPEIAEALITHRFPLEAAKQAFKTAEERSSGAIKVVLQP